ncbi:P-loop containing nucleoside triphosphate hydrolase protein, partial [Jimgerdemannia flammicorona]
MVRVEVVPRVGVASARGPAVAYYVILKRVSRANNKTESSFLMPKDILKVVIIGDGGVGKFIHKRFTNAYKATIGADFITKEVRTEEGKKVMLQIWDTAGQERFQSLGVAYYRGADACVLVYDVNNFVTFSHLDHWRSEFLKQSSIPYDHSSSPPDFPFILIGNKIDLDDRVVSRRQAKAWSQQYSPRTGPAIPCFEASAKDGTGVEEAFTHIARMVKVPQMELDMTNGDIPGSGRRSNGAFAINYDGPYGYRGGASSGGNKGCCA